MEKIPSNILDNTGSVIAIVIGIAFIFGLFAYLIAKGKLNIKSDKLSIESAKQNTKALLAECRNSCSLMSLEFACKYIEKYPNAKYQILYTCELVLNRVEQMIQYNNIKTDKAYIDMRYNDIKAIVDSKKVEEGNYDDNFYNELYDSFVKMIKQIVMIKKHYNED